MKINKLQTAAERRAEREKIEQLQRRFLYYLCEGCNHKEALAICKIQWGVVSNWKNHDKEFKEAYEQAVSARNQWREISKMDELYRRGVEGWYEKIVYKGKVVTEVWRFSERCMISLLRIRFPELCANRTGDYWPPPPRKYEP